MGVVALFPGILELSLVLRLMGWCRYAWRHAGSNWCWTWWFWAKGVGAAGAGAAGVVEGPAYDGGGMKILDGGS